MMTSQDATGHYRPGRSIRALGPSASGTLQGSQAGDYGFCYLNENWTDYSVQANVNLQVTPWGGGLGGRLNPTSGAHYAAWIYPEGSQGGDRVLKLVKFWDWKDWGYNGSAGTPWREVNLTGPVTNAWHTVNLTFHGSQIQVSYDSQSVTNLTDTDTDASHPPSLYSTGGISLDLLRCRNVGHKRDRGPLLIASQEKRNHLL